MTQVFWFSLSFVGPTFCVGWSQWWFSRLDMVYFLVFAECVNVIPALQLEVYLLLLLILLCLTSSSFLHLNECEQLTVFEISMQFFLFWKRARDCRVANSMPFASLCSFNFLRIFSLKSSDSISSGITNPTKSGWWWPLADGSQYSATTRFVDLSSAAAFKYSSCSSVFILIIFDNVSSVFSNFVIKIVDTL